MCNFEYFFSMTSCEKKTPLQGIRIPPNEKYSVIVKHFFVFLQARQLIEILEGHIGCVAIKFMLFTFQSFTLSFGDKLC